MLKAIVSGNGCHIKVTSNCQSVSDFDRQMLVSVPVRVQIHSTQDHACHAQQTKNQNPLNCK